jgi:hypothetical protein
VQTVYNKRTDAYGGSKVRQGRVCSCPLARRPGVLRSGFGCLPHDVLCCPLSPLRLLPLPHAQENRYRLLGEVVEAVKTVYPASHISVRLSPNGVYGGMGSESNYEDFKYFAARARLWMRWTRSGRGPGPFVCASAFVSGHQGCMSHSLEARAVPVPLAVQLCLLVQCWTPWTEVVLECVHGGALPGPF